MKMGYMNMDLVRLRRDCHSRARGWWYPPWRTDLHLCSDTSHREPGNDARNVHSGSRDKVRGTLARDRVEIVHNNHEAKPKVCHSVHGDVEG
jgi:hypothetical protein